MSSSISLTDYELTMFQKLVTRASGIEITESKRDSLSQAVQTRVNQLGLVSPGEYYRFVVSSDPGKDELQYLINEITINETYFFRHPLHFALLEKSILTDLYRHKMYRGEKLRIWSAGCSTGEEVYSLAISCFKCGISLPDSFEILGTDIDASAIEVARKGRYTKRSFRYELGSVMDTYFDKTGPDYLVKPTIRNIPAFLTHNMLEPDNRSMADNSFDIIFCRNVLIYFKIPVVEKILDHMYRILKPYGMLFLGGSETLNIYRHGFSDIILKNTFYYQKRPSQYEAPKGYYLKDFDVESTTETNWLQRQIDLTSDSIPSAIAPLDITIRKSEQISASTEPKMTETPDEVRNKLLERARESFAEEDYITARTLTEDLIEGYEVDLEANSLLSEVLLTMGNHEEAMAICQKILDKNPLHADSCYISACVLKKKGDNDGAIHYFRRAIYLDPNLAMAHFSLANIFRDQKDNRNSRRSYINTIHALDRHKTENVVKFACGFHREILVRTCERNIEHLTMSGQSDEWKE